MKITKKILESLGYIPALLWSPESDIIHENNHYPYNQIKIITRKGKYKLYTDGTHYDISTLSKLISAVYFAGINYGKNQKQQEILTTLGIKKKHENDLRRTKYQR